MNEDLVIIPRFLIFWGFVVWVIFTTVRRYKSTKLQADIQNKLLDKFGSSQDLLSYVQGEAGKQFLNSLTLQQRAPTDVFFLRCTPACCSPSSAARSCLC